MTALSPLESPFTSTEEAEAYEVWFRERVQAALDDPRPPVPHDEAVARIDRALTKSSSRA